MIKQVIVMRKDLNMRKGKMCAQASHASMAFITRRLQPLSAKGLSHVVNLSPVEQAWLAESFTKIVLYVNSEAELLALDELAIDSNVNCHLIQDNGTTEFGGVPTYTCLALGPDHSDRIDAITGDLPLL